MTLSSNNLSVKSSQGTNRPPSSLSRPSSRNTSRPASSATQRPPSSLSIRPTSRTSLRPQSRFSQRPHSRHARSRLVPLCQTLVSQITGLREEGPEQDADGENFREAVEHIVKTLETSAINKAAVGVDMSVIDSRISGHILKARINSKDALGDALEASYKRFKLHIDTQENDLDQDIKVTHLPDHFQFLLTLSQPPSHATVEIAKSYLDAITNPPPPVPTLTWADILADEPFEGEHWEGVYGLPPGSVRLPTHTEPRDRDEWDSTPSLSPLNSDDLALDEDSSFSSTDYEEPLSPPSITPSPGVSTSAVLKPLRSYQHRRQFEELHAKQYWRDDWYTDAVLHSDFDAGDPSTLGPTLTRVLAEASGHQDAQAMLRSERYINEDDMVREILMALQGNKNIVLVWTDNEFTMTPDTPRLVHLSLASQESIVSSLAKTATTVEKLRRFTAAVLKRSLSQSTAILSEPRVYFKRPVTTRTCEAFADAVDRTVRGLDSWCAAQEEAMCRAYSGVDEEPLVISLLSMEKAIRDEFETSLEVLLEVVRTVFEVQSSDYSDYFDQGSTRRSPAALTALLLDTLFIGVQQHMERRDTVTSDTLMRVFVRTAEPVWGMVGKWLRDGMGLGLSVGSGRNLGMASELDDEFFIESSGVGVGMMALGLLDPEFWNEGYALREGDAPMGDSISRFAPRRKAIPWFLEHLAELVLSTGKAVGLIRALGGPPSANGFNNWRTFADLVSLETHDLDGVQQKSAGLFSVSIDTLSRLIYDGLLPQCQVTGALLVKLLVDDCQLLWHMEAIEGFFLMRKGDAMSHFTDILFTKMDNNLQPWADFHFLNTLFSDVIEANLSADAKEWFNPSLIRLSYRGSREKDRSIKRTVKAIDGLLVEYAIPFPLTYIFQPTTIQDYCDIFVFLLQVRRAKSVLERILVRGESGREKRLREELKVLYAMRSRLSWFINTLFNFLTTYVIHAEVSKFRDEFRKARSLDDMIQLHNIHLEKLRGRCLLNSNTSALHRAILSILDMALHFSEGFLSFGGDTTTTLDVSRQSLIMKRHRSRRRRKQKRNVVGFSQILQDDDDSSDQEEYEAEDSGGEPLEPSSFSVLSSSVVSVEGDFSVRVERMSSELDGLVRFLRRGVESFAGGTGEAAPTFGVLAFALEDWDI